MTTECAPHKSGSVDAVHLGSTDPSTDQHTGHRQHKIISDGKIIAVAADKTRTQALDPQSPWTKTALP